MSRSTVTRAAGARTSMAALAGLCAVTLVAAFAAPAPASGVHVQLRTPTNVLGPNQEFDVELHVFQADGAFNAFDAAIRFDPSRLSYVAGSNQQGALMTAACANRFHIFTPAPDSLKITLSLLCSNTTVTGPGVIYRVRMRTGTTTGTTRLSIGPSTQFFNAGFFVNPLEKLDLFVCVPPCDPTGVDDEIGSPAFAMLAPRPNPWSGPGPASFAFDLPSDGAVTLSLHDVSGRVIASRGPAWFEAGRHAITLARPEAPAGIYFARLRTSHGSASRAVVLSR